MKKNKVTILIGAGASTPFICDDGNYLTTTYLTEALFEKSIWQNILDRFNNYKESRIDINDIFFILTKIRELLKTTQLFKNINFESIIHLLDRVSDYLSSLTLAEHGNIDEYLIDFWGNPDLQLIQYAFRKSDHDGWIYVPFLAREVIVASILRLWENNKVKDKAIKSNKNFFKKLIENFESVNIYSLNYDPLLYESLKDINDFSCGFNRNGIFSSNDFYNVNNIIAFVHGHVGFEPLNSEMRFNNNYSNAQKNRIEGIFDITTNNTQYWNIGMKGLHYNTYFITGLDKIDAFSLNPFASYIHRFGKDIIESKYIVLIGLSLKDYHLNAFLTNAIYISNKKIIFVTKSDAERIKDALSGIGDNLILKLWTLFKDTVSVNMHSREDPFKTHLENLYQSLSQNGFGKLTNHIILYIKGVEDFYKEKNLIWNS